MVGNVDLKNPVKKGANMKENTKQLIISVLGNDETVTPEVRDAVLRAATMTMPKRKIINAKEACNILDISRPTLREYVRKGVLEQINVSSRKVRFDEVQVSHLANCGM